MGEIKERGVARTLEGVRVWLRALGCRSSLCEGEFLAGEIGTRGGVLCDDLSTAQAAVILTCSVTAEADRKCRQLVRRARRAVGDNGVIVVCGCWAQGVDAESARDLGVDILIGNRGKALLPDALGEMLKTGRSFRDLRAVFSGNWAWEELPLFAPTLHTRAFVKIQDGCDHFCAYCVIPFLRGRPVSRPLGNVLAEVRRLVGNGCREVVLTGIHLGMYGRDMGGSLAELVRAVSNVAGLERLRLGSLEPFSLDGALLRALAESPVFCPHLHLPLQSGDDGVLALMRRGYTAEGFAHVCETARKVLGEDLHLSSDILVGFPGESEAAFHNTLSLMRRVGMGRTHIFPFSLRRGTVAERLPSRVPAPVRDSRVAEASVLGAELLNRYAERFVGLELNVLAEGEKGGQGFGHTPHFLEAIWDAEEDNLILAPNTLVRVRVTSAEGGILRGRLEK